MEKAELEELKDKVPCAAVLEREGFALDVKESTRKAMKYRRDAAIIIVIHDGKGWFDPLSDGKGDVFSLVEHLEGVPFVEAMNEVADLVGFVPAEPVWTAEAPASASPTCRCRTMAPRRRPWRGSATWRYLRDERAYSRAIVLRRIGEDRLREGPHGSMWAAHVDDDGNCHRLGGARPGQWRGFATGGAKVLFRLGRPDALAPLRHRGGDRRHEPCRARGSALPTRLYLSTGGGWSPATEAAIRALAARPGPMLIVAATDNNSQGEIYAGRLEALAAEMGAAESGCGLGDDWNADLKRTQGRREEMEGEEGRLPHARRSRQG
jgi:hypothetical protein